MMHSAAQALGKRIKDLRLDKRWTQANLAEAVGCESMTVSRYERGEYAPSIEVLEQIAKALDVDIGEFFNNRRDDAIVHSKLRHDLCDIAYRADADALKEIVNAANKILARKR